MNILILGSGGREHALAHKIAESPQTKQLYIAPGNPGTSSFGENIELDLTEFGGILTFCKTAHISMVIVGPEIPLVNGIADFLSQNGIKVVGPNKEAAQLEGSKYYAKVFMEEMKIPTAKYGEFTIETLESAYKYIDENPTPVVLKADGLAGGKGVVILNDREEAKLELKNMLTGKFGTAGNKVVIEQFLDGIEFSVFVLTDGRHYKILPSAKDYKRIGEGDKGLNTGGMGAVSPVPFLTDALMSKVENSIIKPTIDGLRKRNLDYKGFVFIGLILVEDEPYVIEYNVRMGDPETEVVMPRIKSDIVDIFKGIFDGHLSQKSLEVIDDYAATIMLVSGGYPEEYKKGCKINGINDVRLSTVYQAGTAFKQNTLSTNGGRVMSITSLAPTLQEALEKSYQSIKHISFEGMNYRKDIGKDLFRYIN